jgi:hypothetical protein
LWGEEAGRKEEGKEMPHHIEIALYASGSTSKVIPVILVKQT